MKPYYFYIACLFFFLSSTAQAGQSCNEVRPTVGAVLRSLQLAEKTQQRLNSTDAKVVILARAGQDLSKYGLRYSHFGIAFKEQSQEGPPYWHVIHKLNQCGTALSDIYVQGLAEFFMVNLWRYEAAWIIPTPEVQERLIRARADKNWPLRMHEPAYSLVSYAWGQKYQQSNQWALESIAIAISPDTLDNREQAQSWLKIKSYVPTRLQLGPLTRLGARATAINVTFDDHPNEKRFSNQIDTVTVDSVWQWMIKNGWADKNVYTEQ